MSIAAEYLKRRVSVVTGEGRHFLGTLESCDQVVNIVLSSCIERMYALDAGAQEVPLGAYAIRGARVVCIGAVDTVEEATCDVSMLRGEQLTLCR